MLTPRHPAWSGPQSVATGTPLEEGQPADLTVFDLDAKYTVSPEDFQTMGRATPFAGMELYGVCRLTMVNGEIVWREEN